MTEELGLEDVDWHDAGTIRGRQSHRHDTVNVFQAELPSRMLDPNPAELAARAVVCPERIAPSAGYLRHPDPERAPRGSVAARWAPPGHHGAHSHSIVPGGLLVMSSTTRPTGRISLIIREAICSSRS